MAQSGTLVFDLDGVLYVDTDGVPGARGAVEQLRDDGWALLFATNNSTKDADSVLRHLHERTGIQARAGEVITSSQSAARYVAQHYSSARVVGPQALRVALESAGVHVVDRGASDAVVVGLDRHLTYDTVALAARAIHGGAAFVATNTDPTYPTPQGLAPGAGTVVAAIATASGANPVVCGKPSRLFSDLVVDRIATHNVWMVGDRIDTDIAMAVDRGWRSVLTLTGVTTSRDDLSDEATPTHVIKSVADLPDLLRSGTASIAS